MLVFELLSDINVLVVHDDVRLIYDAHIIPGSLYSISKARLVAAPLNMC